ncbi:DUF3078 domain-containing protein [Empedobacter sp. UBA7620]|uniref:DUF3078 domain-containing protein n=1 Tax=Empedobacter sp. UBA7620 TaxID=1946452 RepID=UPI0025C19148|nr:DUF3078 domain-containing protein [Empedobacter sp. UBA7620]
MRLIFSIIFLVLSLFSSAQFLDTSGNLIIDGRKYLKSKVDTTGRKSGWEIYGANTLTVNQNTFSNWMAGGENSVSLNAKTDYEFNFRKKKHFWDNRFIFEYGFLDNKTNGTRKTADNLNITTSYGYLIKEKWYLTSSLNIRSQFSTGYNYGTTPKTKLSNLFAPAYVTIGVGANYTPNSNFSVSFQPLTSRTTIVADKDLQKKGTYGLRNDGDTFLFEVGAYLGGRYKVKLFDNVTYDNNIGIFSNYSNKFYNLDIVYAGLLDMKINNFMSTQLTINLIYDEDQVAQTQFKQALGIGLTYKIDSTKKKDKKKRRKKEILPYFDTSGISPVKLPRIKLDKQNYDQVFDKNTIDEKSTYIKSESIFLE